MSKKNKTAQLVETIAVVKGANKNWPQGYQNERIKGLLKDLEQKLQDELFETLNSQNTKTVVKAPQTKMGAMTKAKELG